MPDDPLADPTPETTTIVAVRGNEEAVDTYLLAPADAEPDSLDGVDARILNAHTGELSPTMPALQAVKRGYWRAASEHSDPDQDLGRLLEESDTGTR